MYCDTICLVVHYRIPNSQVVKFLWALPINDLKVNYLSVRSVSSIVRQKIYTTFYYTILNKHPSIPTPGLKENAIPSSLEFVFFIFM